jgi:hypothetical protein
MLARCPLQIIRREFLFNGLRICPHDKGRRQVVQWQFPRRDRGPVPLGRVNPEE